MSKVVLITLLIIVIPTHALRADVGSVSYYDGGISSSLELILSIEKSLSRRSSISLWGGGGVFVMVLPEFFEDYDAGVEGALEFRFYPKSEDMEGLFIGLYAGLGYMYGSRHKDYERIHTIGIKICNKNIFYVRDPNSTFFSLALEPYISGAVSWYYRDDNSFYGHYDAHAFWVNIGFRIVMENPLR